MNHQISSYYFGVYHICKLGNLRFQANLGRDKYKIDKTTVGGQRTYSINKNNAPVADVIMELVREGEKKVAFSIVKKRKTIYTQ